MIGSFRHKGLKLFYDKDDGRKLRPDHIKRIRRILTVLDEAEKLDDIRVFKGFKLHSLHGDLEGFWAVWVSGNWRIFFRFEDGQADDIDYDDYH